MADDRRRRCIHCRRHVSEVGEISWAGNCEECGQRRLREAAFEMHEHRGPTFQRWRERSIASLGGVLLDEQPRVVQGDSRAS